jgi:hypothetical protein
MRGFKSGVGLLDRVVEHVSCRQTDRRGCVRLQTQERDFYAGVNKSHERTRHAAKRRALLESGQRNARSNAAPTTYAGRKSLAEFGRCQKPVGCSVVDGSGPISG